MKSSNAMNLTLKLFLFLMIGGIVFSTSSCKSKKKLAQEAAAKEYAEKVAKAKAELQAILDDNGTMPLAEMERRLNDIKSQNLNDPEVNALIKKVEEKIAKEKARIKQLELEQKEKEKNKGETGYGYINDYFKQIATAKDVATANAKIAEALKLYASKDVPVLIIISQEAGLPPDYDEPTTIDRYLNYVKDQKKYTNDIYNVKMDTYGQITELELIKK
jgi:3-dehydroquinate synthetase